MTGLVSVDEFEASHPADFTLHEDRQLALWASGVDEPTLRAFPRSHH